MGTKLDFGSLFMETDDGLVQIMKDCTCEDFDQVSSEYDVAETSRARSISEECSGSITLTANFHLKKKHRVLSYNQFVLRLFGHLNNWLKMHGYPMIRSIPLRKRRTRSKKKKS